MTPCLVGLPSRTLAHRAVLSRCILPTPAALAPQILRIAYPGNTLSQPSKSIHNISYISRGLLLLNGNTLKSSGGSTSYFSLQPGLLSVRSARSWAPFSTMAKPGATSRSFSTTVASRLDSNKADSEASSATKPDPSLSPATSPTPPASTQQQQLSEDILTVPNVLTIFRLLATPYIGYLVATQQFTPAVIWLFLAASTDLLDGWIARKTGKYTVFGSIADPAADKALVTTMVISLALSDMLPWSIATIILGRDLALIISAFIIRYRTLQPPKTLQRYFNPRLPSATVTPTQISKYNTFLQLLLVGLLTLYPILFPSSPSPKLLPSDHQEVAVSASDLEESQTKLAGGEAKPNRAKDWLLWLRSADTKHYLDLSITSLMWIVSITTIWSGLGYLGGAGSSKSLKSGLLLSKVSTARKNLANKATQLRTKAKDSMTSSNSSSQPPPTPPPKQ